MHQVQQLSCTVINLCNKRKTHDKNQGKMNDKSKVTLWHMLKNNYNTYTAQGETFFVQTQNIALEFHCFHSHKLMIIHTHSKHTTKHYISTCSAICYTILTCTFDVASTSISFFEKKSKQRCLHQHKMSKSD